MSIIWIMLSLFGRLRFNVIQIFKFGLYLLGRTLLLYFNFFGLYLLHSSVSVWRSYSGLRSFHWSLAPSGVLACRTTAIIWMFLGNTTRLRSLRELVLLFLFSSLVISIRRLFSSLELGSLIGLVQFKLLRSPIHILRLLEVVLYLHLILLEDFLVDLGLVIEGHLTLIYLDCTLSGHLGSGCQFALYNQDGSSD